jgi:hypothetical protein
MGADRLRYRVVELMPPIEDGVLYISLEYMTAVHRCCCGCGERVVTPIGPTDWSVTFHGDTVSLHPSVGNWGLACASHYIVRRGHVEWAPRWSQERIAAERLVDCLAKQRHFEGATSRHGHSVPGAAAARDPKARSRWTRWTRWTRWFSRRGRA